MCNCVLSAFWPSTRRRGLEARVSPYSFIGHSQGRWCPQSNVQWPVDLSWSWEHLQSLLILQSASTCFQSASQKRIQISLARGFLPPGPVPPSFIRPLIISTPTRRWQQFRWCIADPDITNNQPPISVGQIKQSSRFSLINLLQKQTYLKEMEIYAQIWTLIGRGRDVNVNEQTPVLTPDSCR